MTRSLAQSNVGRSFRNTQGSIATITGLAGKRSYVQLYTVQFESGEIFEAELGNLTKGHFKDYSRPTVYGVGISRRRSKSTEPVYRTWARMLERCYCTTFHAYPRYGGNGVRVCERWLTFANFEADVKSLPGYAEFVESPHLYSLDKDVRGDGKLYSPETCIFATYKQQMHAQERVRPIKAIHKDGRELMFDSKHEACVALGIKNANLYKVLKGERNHTGGFRFEVS